MRKKLSFAVLFLALGFYNTNAQNISMEVIQISHSTSDPDGAGPATGSVVLEFRLTASAGTVLADGMGLLFAFQSSALMATPTNTTIPVGPLASASGWTQNVDNRPGNALTPALSYGGRTFDRRMIITFAQATATSNMPVTTTTTGVVRVTYWTLGSTFPHGGYITVEDGGIVPQNSLSSDGGGSEYPYLSTNTPLALGTSTLPVLFTNYNVKCNDKGAILTWATASEQNSSKFEIQRSVNSTDWITIDNVAAAGNSDVQRNYQYLDLNGGTAFYRIRQVDNDGRFIYTAIKRTDCKTSLFDITLYPVPAKDNLNVVIKAEKAIKADLQIFDVNGRIVQRMNTQINKGNNNLVLNVSGLPAGQYLLSGSDPAISINKKFTILR